MAGRRARRPQSVERLTPTDVDDPKTSRAIANVSDAVQALQSRGTFAHVDADLVVGTNVVTHGLGRAVRAVQLTPSVADATFSWAWNRTASNPHPDRQVLIDVIGVAQPNAVVIVS